MNGGDRPHERKDSLVAGEIVVIVIFVAMGSGLYVLGQRGVGGSIDYAMGAHTREDSDPSAWAAAHEATGSGLSRSGIGFVAAGGVYAIARWVVGLSEGLSIAISLVIAGVSLAWIFVAISRGLNHLSN